MLKGENNAAFIDGANLYKGIQSQGWQLDYRRFFIWLREKHSVARAYLFLGFIPGKKDLYEDLRRIGYLLIFKEVMLTKDGVKGNCDAELVLKSVIGYYEGTFEKAVIVSSDGDFSGLVNFLKHRRAFLAIISPYDACSYLLKKLRVPIFFTSVYRGTLEWNPKNEKGPDRNRIP